MFSNNSQQQQLEVLEVYLIPRPPMIWLCQQCLERCCLDQQPSARGCLRSISWKQGFLPSLCEQTEGPGLKLDVQIFLATGRTRVERILAWIQNRTVRDVNKTEDQMKKGLRNHRCPTQGFSEDSAAGNSPNRDWRMLALTASFKKCSGLCLVCVLLPMPISWLVSTGFDL